MMDRTKSEIEKTICARAIDIDITRKNTHYVEVTEQDKKGNIINCFVAMPFGKYELNPLTKTVKICTRQSINNQSCYVEFYNIVK